MRPRWDSGWGAARPDRARRRVGYVRPVRRLEPVDAAWERIIRTTVGLRPYRPSGFVLRGERLGDKLLIHNYGHGGSGMSLSWGTGQMAAEMAVGRAQRQAAVIGCGVVGLSTTRQLQRRGFDVTIYAEHVPPNTTSNMSLASWTPTSGLVDGDRRTAGVGRSVPDRLRGSRGPSSSCSWGGAMVSRGWTGTRSATRHRPVTGGRRERPVAGGSSSRDPPSTGQGSTRSRRGTRSCGRRCGSSRRSTWTVSSRMFEARAPRIVIRRFESRRDLAALSESVIVNCTGLGAKALVGDEELVPLKGQLTLLMPQAGVDYSTFGAASPMAGGFVHMSPRSDGIALGGTSVEGDWSLDPDPDAMRRIVDAHVDLFSRMS